MPAYMLFIREGAVRDEAALAEYRRLNSEAPRDPRVTPLVVYGAIEAIEGPAPEAVLILRFETAQDARDWYANPHYQAALPHRLRGADYRAMIVEGL